MAMKSVFLFTILVVVLVTTQAQAQFPLPPFVFPPLVLPPVGVGASVNISGIVSCSLNASVTSSPPFPNATVNLSCGGIVISSAITNQTGGFTITLNRTQVLSNLLSSCNLVVTTPLSRCNATLPSTGSLQAPIEFVTSIIGGVLSIRNISLGPFGFVQLPPIGVPPLVLPPIVVPPVGVPTVGVPPVGVPPVGVPSVGVPPVGVPPVVVPPVVVPPVGVPPVGVPTVGVPPVGVPPVGVPPVGVPPVGVPPVGVPPVVVPPVGVPPVGVPPVGVPPVGLPPVGVPPVGVPPVGVPPVGVPPASVGALVNISGIVSCSLNASVTPSPPFPNANVNLSCGGIVISSAITNQTGGFTITFNQTQILSNLNSSCSLVVTTPLSTCNATLPSTGTLQAAVQFLTSIIGGVLSIRSISVGPFLFVQVS